MAHVLAGGYAPVVVTGMGHDDVLSTLTPIIPALTPATHVAIVADTGETPGHYMSHLAPQDWWSLVSEICQ